MIRLSSLILVCFALSRPAFAQDSLALKLRSTTKYRFALDFALRLDSALKVDNPELWKINHEDHGIRFSNHSDSSALGEFECYGYHFYLYRFLSFSGKMRFLLLRKWDGNYPLTFYLFSGDSVHPAYLDKYEVGTQQATFRFDTLNGGSVLRIDGQGTGTGFYGHHLFIIGVKSGFFVELFHRYLSYLDATTDTTLRGIGTVTFADLNKDGFLDIVYRLTVDVLTPDQNPNVWNPGELEGAKVLHRLSQVEEDYIWNKEYSAFERSH